VLGVLREEFGKEEVEVVNEEHKGETMKFPFVEHMMPFLAEDHKRYLCLPP
jgi:hypothetical protein